MGVCIGEGPCFVSLRPGPIFFPKPKQMDTATKQLWLVTYGSSGQSINQEMLSQHGLDADECHTAKWRESKYTLVHFVKGCRVHRKRLQDAMGALKDSHGIILTEVFGFDSLACNSQTERNHIEEHPGFMRIVTLLNTQPSEVESHGTDPFDRRSILWKHIDTTDPDLMTRAQLIKRVRRWGPEVRELQRNNRLLDAERAVLAEENQDLLADTRTLRHQLQLAELEARTNAQLAEIEEKGRVRIEGAFESLLQAKDEQVKAQSELIRSKTAQIEAGNALIKTQEKLIHQLLNNKKD